MDKRKSAGPPPPPPLIPHLCAEVLFISNTVIRRDSGVLVVINEGRSEERRLSKIPAGLQGRGERSSEVALAIDGAYLRGVLKMFPCSRKR